MSVGCATETVQVKVLMGMRADLVKIVGRISLTRHVYGTAAVILL